MEKGGSIYVCGDARNMARDVSKALVDIVAAKKGVGAEAASQIIKGLRTNGRYQEDVWS